LEAIFLFEAVILTLSEVEWGPVYFVFAFPAGGKVHLL
jgi:hypothetical protein